MRGTVRDPTNDKKIAPLKEAFGEHFDNLELVKADLLDQPSMHAACEDVTYILHVASPFPIAQPKDKHETIGPAVNGTLYIMEGAHKHGVT